MSVVHYLAGMLERPPVDTRERQALGHWKQFLARYPDAPEAAEVRALLRATYQVSLEDAISADQIFTILMSDGVEQRREYIERHALEATNLDI